MLLIVSFLLLAASPGAWAKKVIPAYPGRVCAYGDFNNDRNTDIVVHRGENLTVLLQDDKLLNVLEDGVFKNSSTFHVGPDIVECSVGDFNGDSRLDVLVSTKKKDGYHHSVWFAIGSSGDDRYSEKALGILSGQAMAVDVDGDGVHDVFGFFENGSMFCQTFDTNGKEDKNCAKLFSNFGGFKPYPGVPHLYVDVVGNDLLSEFVLMGTENGFLAMQVWGRYKHGWKKTGSQIPALEAKYVGAAVVGDFNADSLLELLVPVCDDSECTRVKSLLIWQNNWGWKHHSIDLGDMPVESDLDSRVIFRVGDYSMDGYPDLLVTIVEKGARYSKIVDNKECTTCDANGTRKFELRRVAFIQNREMALGIVTMTSFFDLKEDGTLDLLVEYKFGGETKFSFILNEEKFDTTFLKVQVFTSVCDKQCNPSSTEPGSGISWGGSCMTFSMSDGWGGSLQSAACQLPALTHRSLMAPYVLFGLGRSPNFVDELVVGVPRYASRPSAPSRQHTLKQIVPNSRLIMIPPDNEGTHWQNRLYVTPSQLILQSLFVIASVCVMLLLVVAVLHYREKKEDRVERQQQSHRFHFDAM